MTTPAETLAPHFAEIARQLGRIADAVRQQPAPQMPPMEAFAPWLAREAAPDAQNRPETAEQPASGPVATPTAYNAPGGLKESVEARWHTIRDVFHGHAYRGAVCTCGWTHRGRTHPGVFDPRGEWHDHVTDVILDELRQA